MAIISLGARLIRKKKYLWDNYKWGNYKTTGLTKYWHDNKTQLEATYDAATSNWGKKWRMPTIGDKEKLINGCDWEWTWDFEGTNVPGRIGISKTNKNVIFFPTAGRIYKQLDMAGETGFYWTSSIFIVDIGKALEESFYMIVKTSSIFTSGYDRYKGYSVRAIVK